MTMSKNLPLRRLHGLLGLVIGTFLVLHIGNHLAGVAGSGPHLAAMSALRQIYRHPVAEAVLLAAIAAQITLGAIFVWRSRGKTLGRVVKLQLASGAYLAFFLIVHVSAVLGGRIMLGLDTNYFFAAAGYRQLATALFFIPYYFLAILAVFTHLGCAAYWLAWRGDGQLSRRLLTSATLTGLLVSLLITASLAGLLYNVEIPPAYLQTYSQFR